MDPGRFSKILMDPMIRFFLLGISGIFFKSNSDLKRSLKTDFSFFPCSLLFCQIYQLPTCYFFIVSFLFDIFCMRKIIFELSEGDQFIIHR